MPELKVATFNVEWMVSLFQKDKAKMLATFPGAKMGPISLKPVTDVPGLATRIAGVIRDVDPDVLGIVEGPPLKAQMECFVDEYLDGDYATFSSNSKPQTIYALVRKSLSGKTHQLDPKGKELSLLNGSIFYYPWLGFRPEDRKRHRFDRIPLVIEVQLTGGPKLTLVVVHTKSKISKLKTKKQWEERQQDAVIDALNSRQKLSAEVGLLRQFADERLAQDGPAAALVVMGDFNDGPFRDLLEAEFLLQNIIDELVGSVLEPDKYLRHAMNPDAMRTAGSVRFNDALTDGKIVTELIDHILISPGIASGASGLSLVADSCRLERATFDKHDDDEHNDNRGLRPSDHVPVSAVFSY